MGKSIWYMKKMGMTNMFVDGKLVPVTLMRDLEGERKFCDDAHRFFFFKKNNLNRSRRSYLEKIGLKENWSRTRELRDEKDIFDHVRPNQIIKIQGKTKGKGFQGVVKRHGFKILGHSHGVGIVARKGGSKGTLGMNRIIKGKKMPGRMGGTNNTAMNTVMRFDKDLRLIAVKGSIPGNKGSLLKIFY